MRYFLAITLVFAIGCSGKRPPQVKAVSEFNRKTIAQALADKKVRDKAYQKTLFDAEKQKIDNNFNATMLMANTVQIDPKLGPVIVGKNKEGKEVKEPLQLFIRRNVKIKEDNVDKIAAQLKEERKEDAKVNKKLETVLRMYGLEQAYLQKVEEGGINPEDVESFVGTVIEAVKDDE